MTWVKGCSSPAVCQWVDDFCFVLHRHCLALRIFDLWVLLVGVWWSYCMFQPIYRLDLLHDSKPFLLQRSGLDYKISCVISLHLHQPCLLENIKCSAQTFTGIGSAMFLYSTGVIRKVARYRSFYVSCQCFMLNVSVLAPFCTVLTKWMSLFGWKKIISLVLFMGLPLASSLQDLSLGNHKCLKISWLSIQYLLGVWIKAVNPSIHKANLH